MLEAMLDVLRGTEDRPEAVEVRRICLHCAEAVENYLADAPPPNYGSNLRRGVRSRAGSPPVPHDEVAAYVKEVRQRAREYLPSLDLARDADAWGQDFPPLRRVLYVLRHTQYHLGQVSELVRDTYGINRLCRP